MNENTTLDSKLKKYAALATGITAVAGITNAQVVYTDINPDHLVTGNLDTYLLDLNNDNTPDFSLSTLVGSFSGSFTTGGIPITYNINYKAGLIYPGSGNSWMANSSDTTIASVPVGSYIGSSDLFATDGSALGAIMDISIPLMGYSVTYPYGPFLAQEGFAGLKFQIGGNTHYGWVRVEVTADGTILSVKDYAYDATPNTAIVAGETGSGPVGVESVEKNISIQNFNNQLMIELNDELTNCIAVVTSITGQEVINQAINNTIEMIELNDLSKGIYVVSVNSDQGMVNKKIYIR
tara:strand:+ start:1145 stop:2026 length:882 start_codon:yes stop_codon:yes gene_type:complete